MPLPRLALAVYGASVPVFQEMLGIPNFGICWVGESCTGKSIAAALAASTWGDPDPLAQGTSMQIWGDGREYLERVAQDHHCRPYVLDDVLSEPQLPFLAGAILSGRGRRDGERCSWRTVLLTSSTSPIDEMAGGDFLVGKVLNVFGSPFGKQGPEQAMIANRLRCGIGDNCGHFLTELEARAGAQEDQWEGWKKAYQAAAQLYAGTGGKRGGKGAAHGTHLAALATVGGIVHQLFPELPGDPQGLMDELWRWMLTTGKIASRQQEAIDIVRSHISTRARRLWNNTKHDQAEPPGGWLGRIVRDDSGVTIYWINQDIVENLLQADGLDPLTIYREWALDGVIECAPRATKQIWIKDRSVRCVGFIQLF